MRQFDMITAALQQIKEPIPGPDVAKRTGLTKKQTADMLTKMHTRGLVTRHGRKLTARWELAKPPRLAHQLHWAKLLAGALNANTRPDD